MADEKVIVMSKGTTFTVNAVVKALRDNAYDVRLINPIEEEIIDAKKYAKAFVIFLGPFITNADFMVFLGKTLEEMQAKAVLLGDGDQFPIAQGFFPQGLIEDQFEKPFGVKKVVDSVNLIFRDVREKRLKSILLIDDDAVFLKMVRGWLNEDYDVVPVNSGAQALQYLAIHKPDLILLDYEMPILNGPQVLESIRSLENLKDIPVLFLTSVDEKKMVSRAISLKPDGYLLKSYNKNKLLEVIVRFFENK